MGGKTGRGARDIQQDLDRIGVSSLFAEDGPGAHRFKLSSRAPLCDVVMKGGVTSGVVYPYAVLRLAQKFRFAGIGGTSAGAMAAALTAAAEYARQRRGDPLGYCRFEQRCLQLPQLLSQLFQPHATHLIAFSFMMAALRITDRSLTRLQRFGAVLRLLLPPAGLPIWLVLVSAFAGGALTTLADHWPADLGALSVAGAIGVVSGVLALGLFLTSVKITSRLPMLIYLAFLALIGAGRLRLPSSPLFSVPAALCGALGMVAAIIFFGNRLIIRLRQSDFGLCPGLRRRDDGPPGVTDWLHEAIQHVAGRPAGPPLTFGEIEGPAGGAGGPNLALRMITTNLSLGRPYALPDIDRPPLGWRPSEWRELFPADVIDYLKSTDPDQAGRSDHEIWRLPEGARLPIVVGARMSLSFPVLFSAVPVYDYWNRKDPAAARMLLVDGGLSSNMPLHFFDSLGPPAYPTFAFDLEDTGLPASKLVEPASRITLHQPGQRPPRLARRPIIEFNQYLRGVLNAAKDWQDNLLSIMPGQFERIVRIRLASDEGGLNLAMPPERSRRLMRLGYLAGTRLAEDFDLRSHQVRRALVAYQEIERVANAFSWAWTKGRVGELLTDARAPAGSVRAWKSSGAEIIVRLGAVASWAAAFGGPLRNRYFPRPRGSLRITPNLSGDRS